MLPYLDIMGHPFPSYGMSIAVGALAAILLSVLVTRNRHGFDFVDYCFLLFWAAIFGIVGAKLLYLIVEMKSFLAQPKLFWLFLRGGGVFYGGLLGGLGAAIVYVLRHGWNLLACLDTCAAPFCFAHAFGRIGCFLGGCCYGAPTDSVFGVVFPEGGAAPAGVPLLPTQLFEAAFLFLLGGILMIVLFRSKKVGLCVSGYLFLYGIWRFVLEFFRADDRGAVGMLSTSQFISIFLIIAGLLLLLLLPKANAFFEALASRKRLIKSK